MREYVWLECSVCGARNYRTHKETRGAGRLELKKFLPEGAETHSAQRIAEKIAIGEQRPAVTRS